MTLPLLERALAAIAGQLATITEANGYNTDAGLSSFRQRVSFTEDDLPCLNLKFLGEAVTAGGGKNVQELDSLIGVEIHVYADQETSGTAMVLGLSDIKRCLGSWTYSEGVRDADGGICGLNFTGAEPVERADGSVSEGMRLTATLVRVEARGDPTKKSKFAPN